MSFKYYAQKTGNNVYTLPKTAQMKCDVIAFLSEDLYNASEESMWSQAATQASYDGVIGAYLMPDCHQGFGVPVGSVTVTDGTIIQAGSGYDIGCGISSAFIPNLSVEKVADPAVRKQWIEAVEKRVATGIGSNRPKNMPSYSKKKLDEVLYHGAKALGIRSDFCERHYIPVSNDIDLSFIEKAYEKAVPQFGSLGGGNHYIELQCTTSGEVWFMIHTGSRGYGWQTANHFFYEGAKARNLASNRREESWVYLTEDVGKKYWDYHNTAANYAIANRFAIASAVNDAMEEVFKVQGEIFYDISHNLVQEETLFLPDGSTKNGFVHRKGSTRAFPAGHPDLNGTKWEKTGHPVLIPGSMYDGAAILFPSEDAYKTICSVNHGSGRVLGRGAAKRQLDQDIIDKEMSSVCRTFGNVLVDGIVSNHAHIPMDESKHVYKDLDEVLNVLEQENIAKVKHRMFPIANIKGAE